MATHYETLGVSPTADVAAIRRAYIAKARVHHPDRHAASTPATQAASARAMRQVNAAWAVLSTSDARRRYDESLRLTTREAPRPTAPRATSASPRPAMHTIRAPDADDDGADGRLDDDDVDLVGHGLRFLPAIALFVILFGIFIFTAFAASNAHPDAPVVTVPGELRAGSCVRAAAVLTTVPCDRPHDAIIESVVSATSGCPPGNSLYVTAPGRVACLLPVP